MLDSNQRPPACEAGALPTELIDRGRDNLDSNVRGVNRRAGLRGLRSGTRVAVAGSGMAPVPAHTCPQCTSDDVKRVRRDRALDRLVSLLGWRAYGCRACGRRFYDRPLHH